MANRNLLEHFQGCIIGKCVDDALGFLVEGSSQADCILVPLLVCMQHN